MTSLTFDEFQQKLTTKNKVNSDLIKSEFFIESEGCYIHQIHETQSIGGRVTAVIDTVYNPESSKWMVRLIDKNQQYTDQTQWYINLREANSEFLQLTGSIEYAN